MEVYRQLAFCLVDEMLQASQPVRNIRIGKLIIIEICLCRNRALDGMIYQMEKSLADLGEKVPGDVRGEMESLMNDLRALKDSWEAI